MSNSIPDKNSLDLQDFYRAAKNLRAKLLDTDPDVQSKAAVRFSVLRGLDKLTIEEIPQKDISLNQAKQVIARELGYVEWADLKNDLQEKIQAIQMKTGVRFIPGIIPLEAGDVIQGDVIKLGCFSNTHYAIDAILLDVFELHKSPHGPGYELHALDPIDFDPDRIPDLPDEEHEWPEWSKEMAHVLGLS
jgi:hypothetical protein